MRLAEESQEIRHFAAEILEVGADVIDEYGWTQRALGNAERGFCLSGSLTCALKMEKFGVRDIASLTMSALSGDAESRLASMNIRERLEFRSRIVAEVAERLIAEGDPYLSRISDAILASEVVFWNDAHDRTKSDVTNALRKTALTLKELF